MVDATSLASVSSLATTPRCESRSGAFRCGRLVEPARAQRGVFVLRARPRETSDSPCRASSPATPEGIAATKNQGPLAPTLPSSLRRGSIRGVFHHQGLARLGATPFRDAVTMVDEALFFPRSGTSPRLVELCHPFTLEKLKPGGSRFNPRARHAS